MTRRLAFLATWVAGLVACPVAGAVPATGSTWHVVPSPTAAASRMLDVVVTAAGNPIGVGSQGSRPVIYAFSGGLWHTQVFGMSGALYGVSQTSARQVAVGGEANALVESRLVPGGSWHAPAGWGANTYGRVTYRDDATIPGSGHTLMVGWRPGTAPGSTQPVVAVFDGVRVAPVPVAFTVSESANRPIHAAAVAACAETRGYIGVNAATAHGQSSSVWLWNGSKVTATIPVPNPGVRSITCIPGSTSVLVTSGRFVLKLSSTHHWTTLSELLPAPPPPPAPGQNQTFNDIALASATNGTAVGDVDGWTIWHYNGSSLRPLARPSLLNSVAFRPGSTTEYAVGSRRTASTIETLVERSP